MNGWARPAWLVALVLLSPLLLATALLVLVGLGRPVLFRQMRSGRHGVPFEMVKFRSMRSTVDAVGRLLPDAQRVTPIGRFLRRSRLDELPELYNMMRGEMALVGPRPLLPDTVAAMGADGAMRGRVAPGLTGWAQVNGNALLDQAEKLRLDLWYVAHRTVRLDLAILLRTLLVVILGERRTGWDAEAEGGAGGRGGKQPDRAGRP